jgi:iron complex outermembrane receptor protein
MNKKTLKKKLFKKSLLAVSISSALSCGLAVQAQDDIEEITITGSRIRVTQGMAEPVPVTVMTPDELSSLSPGGTGVEQMSQLPQFFNTESSQRGSGTLFSRAGGSYLNMRNLGLNRTLVLLDGSRLPPADKRGSVNADMLPTALMRSVDTVTGGASAAYGADALGGVVNYILDREFQGFKVDIGTGRTEWGDGDRYNMGVAGGFQIGERLNVIGSFNTTEIDQIARRADEVMAGTDWFKQWGHVTCPQWAADRSGPQRCTVPYTVSTRRAPSGMLWSREGDAASTRAPLTDFAMQGMVFTDDGQGVRPFVKSPIYAGPLDPGTTNTMGGDANNPEFQVSSQGINAVNGRGVKNRSGFVGLQYEFSDNLTGFAQALGGRSESRFQNNTGGMNFDGGWHGKLFSGNPFLPASVQQAMDDAGIENIQTWNNEQPTNPDNLDYGHEESGVFTTQAYSAGFDYEFENGWALKASYQTGESHRMTGIFNEQRVDNTYVALDTVVDPDTGAYVCNVNTFNPTLEQLAASTADRLASPGGVPGGTANATTTAPLASPIGLDGTIERCTPLNIIGLGNSSAAAKAYINTPKMGDGLVEQDFAEVLITGELYEGWGYGPVSFAAGLTWRDQSFNDQALPTEVDVLGPPVNVPSLGIRGIPPGYAAGSSNLHARSTVPNVGGGYDVTEWFGEVNAPFWESDSGDQRIGGSAAFRQSDYSNLSETLDSWKLGLDVQVFEDLRLRITRSTDIREATFSERFDTQSTGTTLVDPFLDGVSYQTTVTSGGNPGLRPETARTNVAGFVYQPSWLPGLNMSADWYDIKVGDSIAQLGPQRVVDECFAGNQVLCGQLVLDSGAVGRIFDVFLNVASARVKGVDFELTYNMEPNFFDNQQEDFSIRTLAGFVKERSDTPFGNPSPTHLEGSRDNPEINALMTANYGIGPWNIQLQQRYVDSVLLNRRWVEGVHVDDNTISSGNQTNGRLRYTSEMANGGEWTVSFDVTNMFDRGHPIIAGGSQAVEFDYDVYGRRYFLSLNASF